METLPDEIVLKIGHLLTPEALARCCVVSRGWREAFDRDCLWKPHCDPELEEHLRTTPSVVEPVFVTPRGEDSTLDPVSQWRLAFMREQHLWNNWKCNIHKKESFLESENEANGEFVTNTLVVRWCENHFEVWDVSSIPAVFVAKTDPSVVDIARWIACSVADESLLVVEQIASVKVFYVDVLNKYIQLKHDISLVDHDIFSNVHLPRYYGSDDRLRTSVLDIKWRPRISLDDVEAEFADPSYIQFLPCYGSDDRKLSTGVLGCIKGSSFVHVNVRSSLDIFDLQTGMKVKEEPCPVVRNGKERPKILGIRTSANSDYVVVVVELKPEVNSYNNDNIYYHYIYSPKALSFLPGPILKKRGVADYGELYKHYYAANDNDNCFTIYDCHSQKVLLRHDRPVTSNSGLGFNDSFIVKQCKFELGVGGNLDKLKMFSLSSKTSTIIHERKRITDFNVFNNKLLVARDDQVGWCSMIGNVWVRCDISFDRHTDINRVFTKVIMKDALEFQHGEEWHIHHYW